MAKRNVVPQALPSLPQESSGVRPVRFLRPGEGEELATQWQELANQILLLTGGDGLAIALLSGGKLRCRISRGRAPLPGAPIDARSGLTGACLRTGTVLRCDDTEEDLRVDREVCRTLGIRSIVCVPVGCGQEVAGIFEIFSRRPGAFVTIDIAGLRALAGEIANCFAAEEALARAAVLSPADLGAAGQPGPAAWLRRCNPFAAKAWRALLGTLVLALGLFLLLRAIGGLRPAISAAVAPGSASDAAIAPPAEAAKNGVSPPRSVSRHRLAARSNASKTTPSPARAKLPTRPAAPALAAHSLQPPAPDRLAALVRSASNPFQQWVNSLSSPPPTLSETAGSPTDSARPIVIRRVEPVYPALARQSRIEGEVVLEANVDEHGRVRRLRVLSGNSLLAAAAVRAVRQWRYQPYRLNGKAVRVPIQITLKFELSR